MLLVEEVSSRLPKDSHPGLPMRKIPPAQVFACARCGFGEIAAAGMVLGLGEGWKRSQASPL